MSANLPGAGPLFASQADKLTIETPEQTALEFTIAGIGSRFVAIAIDTLIQVGAGIVVGIAAFFGIRALSRFGTVASVWAGAILILFYFLLYFGYFACFEVFWNGQTPGKRAAGIRVIKDSGRPLTPAESIGRNLMRIVDLLPTFYAVGIVSCLLTKESKRLGDLVVGALVVRESSLSELRLGWQSAQANPTAAPLGALHLSAEEHALIDSYLARRHELEPQIRSRMADEILRRVRAKLDLTAQAPVSADRVLETLAYERRAMGRYS